MENRKSETIQIAICDDEPLILKRLTELVKKVIRETGKPFTICAFQSGQDLIKQIAAYHMVFLDMEMAEMDGIQTGREILKRNIVGNAAGKFPDKGRRGEDTIDPE